MSASTQDTNVRPKIFMKGNLIIVKFTIATVVKMLEGWGRTT